MEKSYERNWVTFVLSSVQVRLKNKNRDKGRMFRAGSEHPIPEHLNREAQTIADFLGEVVILDATYYPENQKELLESGKAVIAETRTECYYPKGYFDTEGCEVHNDG